MPEYAAQRVADSVARYVGDETDARRTGERSARFRG